MGLRYELKWHCRGIPGYWPKNAWDTHIKLDMLPITFTSLRKPTNTMSCYNPARMVIKDIHWGTAPLLHQLPKVMRFI